MEQIERPAKGERITVDQAMALAISEASKGAVFASPNPLVGCVVLDKEGRYLSSGFHERCGGPHAEVVALAHLSAQDLEGAHVIVTLEPCAHEGRTPSCAKMLAQLPIRQVTFGLIDPNPLVSGQGVHILRSAGKQVQQFTENSKLREVCEVFLWNQSKKLPFVSLKIAASLDGKIGLKNGQSKWITSEKARSHSHYLRAIHDAILIGSGTLFMDNPSLDIREFNTNKKNKIVVLDTEGKSLGKISELNIFKKHDFRNIFVIVSKNKAEMDLEKYPSDLNILFCPTLPTGLLDLEWILKALYKKEIYSLFVEGGGKVASQFILQHQVNRLYLFQAPILIGGKEGVGWTEDLQINDLSNKRHLQNLTVMSLDPDFLVTGVFKNE